MKRVFASYFFKHQQILFCRKGRQLYFNFFANNNWGGDLYSGDVFEEDFGKESYHHVTATVRHHYVRSQGEDWLEAKLYLDGELVAQKRYPNMRVDNSRFPLEIGTASSLSSVWHSKADFAEVEIFDRALTEEEVEELFFRQKMVSKKRSGVIAGDAEVFLKQLKLPEHELSSLRNLARSGVKLDELKKYAAAPQKYFRTLPGKESLLTLFTPAGAVRIISWYDRHTRRELLSYDAAFFSLEGRFNGKRVVLSPLSESVKSDFLQPVQQKDGRWSFTIQSTLADDAVAQCRYQFVQDRIELQVSLDNRNKNLHFSYLNQPDVRLNPLQTTVDHLLVPIMSGVAYPAASANGAHFSDVYPRGSASMQLGAYYDGASGVYWTTLDPTAGFKKFNFSAGRKRISASAAWPIPGASASPERNFTPKGPAALELFRGNWYDAGLLYRKDLQNMRPLWWRPTLPNTDTPQWFRNNAFVIRRLPGTQDDIPILRQLRDFLENKFLVEWQHDKASNQYSPMMRMSPETVAWIRDMHQLGLKTIPYTDPRLWQVFDRRDEDTMFSKVVRPHCIVEDGKLLIERYENRPCGVVCAVSPYIQQMMQQMMFNLINVGFDGIYADQVGAARPHLCEVSAHGHAVRDGSSHFISGWVPMFDKVRKQWQKSAPSAILATEDNAEHCVGMMDAMLPWRWMYEHQVPLYCLVYSGRTQFIGREPDCEEPKAIYPKAATQLVNSEQIGYIEHQLATSPLRNTYRVFLKQLIHLRLAMLDFFNCGMMSRPPQFDRPWSRETLIWGVRGTGSVTSEAVLSSAWQLDKLQAIVLVNHTDQLQQNTLRYQLLSPKNQISVWRSTTHEVQKLTADAQLKLPFSLPPRSSMLIIAAPEKFDLARQTRQINERFKVIVQAPQTPDLFAIDPGKMRNTNAGAATDWHHARHAAAVSGARLDEPRNQINWIRDAVVSVGTVDFADGSAQILEATFAAPPRSGLGKAEFYIDDLQSKNKFAEFVFDQKSFLTDSWNTFRSRQQKINQKITGQHRVFIKLEGSSFCNLQSWRMK